MFGSFYLAGLNGSNYVCVKMDHEKILNVIYFLNYS